MAEVQNVMGNINVSPDCKERVALELMQHIYGWEGPSSSKNALITRGYWLKLYAECLNVVNGNLPK